MVGLISTQALDNLEAMAVCPLKPARPARPAEYVAAVAAALGNNPLPMDPSTPSPVDELDARWQLAVGMSVWQWGRFLKVADISPYEPEFGLLSSVRLDNCKDITLIGEDGSRSCLLAGGNERVPVYCWVR